MSYDLQSPVNKMAEFLKMLIPLLIVGAAAAGKLPVS